MGPAVDVVGAAVVGAAVVGEAVVGAAVDVVVVDVDVLVEVVEPDPFLHENNKIIDNNFEHIILMT